MVVDGGVESHFSVLLWANGQRLGLKTAVSAQVEQNWHERMALQSVPVPWVNEK